MINSREISDLTLEAERWFERFREKVENEIGLIFGHDWIVTSTYRDQECQNRLYAQGRTEPGPIVTWTQHSRHTSRRAWDVAIKDKNGRIDWSIKADVNHDQIPDYQHIALIGKDMGLNCGYFWKKRDMVHYEIEEGI